MNSLQQYLELFLNNREAVDSHSAHLLNLQRGRALEVLEHATLPRLREEGNVVTSPDELFAPDYGVNINRINIPADVAAAFRCDVPNMSTLLGVVVNDSFHPSATLAARIPQGVTFCSLREACERFPGVVKEHLGTIAPVTDPAVALNTLLTQEGVFIHIGRGVRVDRPLQLVNLFSSPAPLMGVRRVLIVAEEGSEASVLVCDHTGNADVGFLSSQVVEISVGVGARLDYYDMESSTPATSRHSSLFVRQERDSRFNAGNFTLACGTTRNNINIDVAGTGCETFVGGMAIASDSQRVDNNSRINHLAPRCKSNQMFKYVLDGEARGGFEGRILVTAEAQFTEAYQSNRNMLASADARMHTEPQLEIYCDEVKCSHGATTGQLDEDALFYMRQRGIPLRQARTMLMQAFMADVIDAVSMESLRDRLRHLVERRFEGASESCSACAGQCNKTK